jgi:hypothetical protein
VELDPTGAPRPAGEEAQLRIIARLDRLSLELTEAANSGGRAARARAYAEAGRATVGLQLGVMRERYGELGLGYLVRKLARVRPRHVRLCAGYLQSRLRASFGSLRKS